MKVIGNEIYKYQFDIKKSTFVSITKKITSKKELNDFINTYSDPLATHNCYAYKIGIENQQAGYNDDGEPKGTAGMPIFNIIEKHDLTNIVILVIRYYGGIKLGAGPLMRTYSKSANELIDNTELFEIKPYKKITISFPINIIKEVDNLIHLNKFNLISKEFNDSVSYTFLTSYNDEVNFINKDITIVSIEKTYL